MAALSAGLGCEGSGDSVMAGADRSRGAAGAPEAAPRRGTAPAGAGGASSPRGPGAVSAPKPRNDETNPPVQDAFAARNWVPRPTGAAAPKPAASAPPPVASAPTPPPRLAYALVGKLTEQGEAPVYIFERGQRVVSVRPGQWLDSQHRLESASATELIIVQVPGDVRYTLRIGP